MLNYNIHDYKNDMKDVMANQGFGEVVIFNKGLVFIIPSEHVESNGLVKKEIMDLIKQLDTNSLKITILVMLKELNINVKIR